MKKFFTILMAILLALFVNAQEVTIAGKVVDAKNGEALPGVSILLEGTNTGVISDFEGIFEITVPKNNSILVFSFVSYITKKVDVKDKAHTIVELMPDTYNLNEVVVIGYGTQKKSDLTGSVSSVDPDVVNPGPILSVDNILQNTVPGVVLTQTSAQPGGGFDIKIRGTSSILGDSGPLYVIDGMPINSENSEPESSSPYRSSPAKNPLNGINPDDILSIEVLKDASATAIYGARGANGVILITTKKGKKGKLKVDYSGSYSIQTLDNEYEMLSAKEFATVSNEYHLEQNPGSDPIYSPAEINKMGEGTNWMKEITRTGSINKHQISVSGGGEKITYYASGGYFNHEGIVDVSGLRRFSGNVNTNIRPNENLEIGINIIGSNVKDKQVPFGASDGIGEEFAGLFDNTRTWSPLIPVRQPDGSFSRHPVIDIIPNPVSLLNIEDIIKRNRLLSSAYFEYRFLNNFKARMNVGYDYLKTSREAYVPISVIRGEQANGEAEFANTSATNLLGEFTLHYNSRLLGNNLSVLGGTTFQQFDAKGDDLLISNFADHASSIDEIKYADTLNSFFWQERSRLLSFIGRVNYNIKDKYLFTFSFRADASTKFGPNNKWGYFPSGAFAWKINNEEFFKSNTISLLKLRLSYGQIGNQEIGNKLSQALYSYSRKTVIGGVPVSGLAALRPQNDDLKWETTTQFNAGMDIAVLDGRIQSSIDIYQKLTTDVLLSYELPATSGFADMTANYGKIKNRGVEFMISSVNISNPITWTTSLNFAFNKSNWVDRAGYYPAGRDIEDENAVVGGIYGYIADGIFKTPEEISSSAQPGASLGMIRFRDINGDGRITPSDRTLLGKNEPDFTFGFNNILSYENFEISFFFMGMFGREKENYTLADLEDIQSILAAYNKSVNILDRWTPSNPNGNIQSGMAPSDGGDNFNNTIYVQNASFIKLRNITMVYNIYSIRFIDVLKVYVDAQNLLTFTKYQGIDPETNDFRQYPNAKTFTLGVKATF